MSDSAPSLRSFQPSDDYPKGHEPVRRASVMRSATSIAHSYSDIPQITLNVDKSKVSDLMVPEGTHEFTFWFIVSSYVPVLTACLSPFSNMISVAALVSKWRVDVNKKYVGDTRTVYVLNAFSLALGVIGNCSVVLNFGGRSEYKKSQAVSITTFFIASMLLLTAVLVAHENEFESGVYFRSEGFWFAVLTTIFYFSCASLCSLNLIGALLKKYPPIFNLNSSERGLILYTLLLAVWFLWGAALFSSLIDMSYGDAMYFCTVSLLTIGLGDIIPLTNTAKGLVLVYSLSGLIILGLIIAMIRTMVNTTTAPVMFWNSTEMRRKKVLAKVKSKGLHLSQEDSFDLMRSLRKEAKIHQRNVNSIVTLLVFIAFWLLGALIFHFTEGWSFFDAVYFCFLCLLTIGYGDYTPSSAAGRPIFIVWALGAVPLMTALISNLGDTLYNLAISGVRWSERLNIFRKTVKEIKQVHDREAKLLSEVAMDEDVDDDDLDLEETRTTDQIIEEASKKQNLDVDVKKSLFSNMRELLSESKLSPNKRYNFDQWKTIIDLLQLEDEDLENLGIDSDMFWLSDKSPLRYPISEPNYLLFLLFSKLEALVTDEAEALSDFGTRESETSSRIKEK